MIIIWDWRCTHRAWSSVSWKGMAGVGDMERWRNEVHVPLLPERFPPLEMKYGEFFRHRPVVGRKIDEMLKRWRDRRDPERANQA